MGGTCWIRQQNYGSGPQLAPAAATPPSGDTTWPVTSWVSVASPSFSVPGKSWPRHQVRRQLGSLIQAQGQKPGGKGVQGAQVADLPHPQCPADPGAPPRRN